MFWDCQFQVREFLQSGLCIDDHREPKKGNLSTSARHGNLSIPERSGLVFRCSKTSKAGVWSADWPARSRDLQALFPNRHRKGKRRMVLSGLLRTPGVHFSPYSTFCGSKKTIKARFHNTTKYHCVLKPQIKNNSVYVLRLCAKNRMEA